MSTTLGPGGCTYNAQCDAASNCVSGPPVFRCCKADGSCWTEVFGLVARLNQTVDANTPRGAILHAARLPGRIGFIVVGDCDHFKAGEVISAIDGQLACEGDTWQAWLDKGAGASVFTVLDAATHRPSDRTITRL